MTSKQILFARLRKMDIGETISIAVLADKVGTTTDELINDIKFIRDGKFDEKENFEAELSSDYLTLTKRDSYAITQAWLACNKMKQTVTNELALWYRTEEPGWAPPIKL